MSLISLDNALKSAIGKVVELKKNQLALPAREQRLTEIQAQRLNEAIEVGWTINEVRGPWKSGEHGFEDGDLLDVYYSPNDLFSEHELISVINEAKRPGSKHAIGEHLAALASHKRYNGGQGFTFVVSDLVPVLSSYSELAIKNAFDYFKFQVDGAWFPETSEIIGQVKWAQRKIDNLSEKPGANP